MNHLAVLIFCDLEKPIIRLVELREAQGEVEVKGWQK